MCWCVVCMRLLCAYCKQQTWYMGHVCVLVYLCLWACSTINRTLQESRARERESNQQVHYDHVTILARRNVDHVRCVKNCMGLQARGDDLRSERIREDETGDARMVQASRRVH